MCLFQVAPDIVRVRVRVLANTDLCVFGHFCEIATNVLDLGVQLLE